jgi:hypothetical protein
MERASRRANRRQVPAEPESLTDEQALEAFSWAVVVEPQIKQAVAAAKARVRAQATPTPVKVPDRHDEVEVQTNYIGAGEDKSKTRERRALTYVERTHLAGGLSFEEAQAGRILQQWFLKELGGSVGIGGYDPSARPEPGWQKADRQAVRILQKNRTNRSRLSGLLFATCGIEDQNGLRVFDTQLATLVVQAVTLTTDPLTAGAVGATRGGYAGVKQRQASGSAIIREALRRAAAHLAFVRLPEFDPEWSWRVTTDVAR